MLNLTRAAILTSLLWLALISPWVFGGLTIPWDAKAHWYPHLVFLSKAIHGGESLLWTPNIFTGSPEIADPQSALFILPLLITALLSKNPTPQMMDFSIFVMILLGMIAVLIHFKQEKWNLEGGVIAALAFGFGASMAWRLQHINQISTLCLFPICLLLLNKTLETTKIRWAIAASLIAVCIALSRDQVSLLILYWLLFYTIFRLLKHKTPLKLITPLAIASFLALALIALPLALTNAWGEISNRPVIDELSAGRGSLHPANILTLFIGNLFGAAGEFKNHWGFPSLHFKDTGLFLARNMSVLYIGALPALLLIIGLRRKWLWESEIRFYTISTLIIFLFCIGWYSPVFDVLYTVLPLVKSYRRPADGVFLLGGLLSIIAGFVWHKLRENELKITTKDLIIPTIMLLTGISLALYKDAWGIASTAIIIALVTWGLMLIALKKQLFLVITAIFSLDLYVTNGTSESTALPVETYDVLNPQSQNETIAFLKANLKPLERVELRGLGYHFQNVAMSHNLYDILGFNPLREGNYSRMVGTEDIASLMEQRRFPETFKDYESPLADQLGLRFIVTGKPLEGKTAIKTTKDGFIYERTTMLSRAIISNGTVKITHYSNAKIILETNNPAKATLILHDLYHPWWFATVNEKPVAITRQNTIFRGLEVPEGQSKIIMTFQPIKGIINYEKNRYQQ